MYNNDGNGDGGGAQVSSGDVDGGSTGVKDTFQSLVWAFAGACTLLSCWLTISQVRGHRNHFSRPDEQRKIIGILLIVPIFAVNSWLSLRFHHASVYIDMVRDCYEGYVLHLFLSLMIVYLSPEAHKIEELTAALPDDRKYISHPFPLGWCLQPWRVDKTFLKSCKRATLQFCIMKPAATILASILESQDLYREGEIDLSYGYVYISFAMNLSITWAAWVLVLFYLAFKPELAPHQPAYKFLCIKAVLFLSFWQSVALAIAAQLSWIHEIGSYTSTDVKTGINNLLLCIEMLFISYLHKRAFPYRQYKMTQGNISNGSLLDNLAVMDTVRDFNDAKPLGERIVLPTGFKPEVRSSKKAFPMVGVSDDDANLRIGSSRIEDDYVPLDITEQSVQPEALDAETELGWRE